MITSGRHHAALIVRAGGRTRRLQLLLRGARGGGAARFWLRAFRHLALAAPLARADRFQARVVDGELARLPTGRALCDALGLPYRFEALLVPRDEVSRKERPP